MIEGDGRICYYNNDVVGLPREVCDETGNILWSAKYDAFGKVEEVAASNGFDNPLRLQGQYADDDLNLHYNRYRYFDPDSCSFISKDPLGLAAGVNLYSYAPNVWGWVDPLGLCKTDASKKPVRVNLGGEGEVPGAINVQPGVIGDSLDAAAENAARIKAASGQPVVCASGDNLPFGNKSVDEVYLNNAPLDKGDGFFGPSFTTDEINRILKDNGKFFHDGLEK